MSCDESTPLLQRGHHIIVVDCKECWQGKDYGPVFTTADCSYGLTLEELLPFTLDPWWQKVRRLCLASLWLTFVLTLLAALGMAYVHGSQAATCRPDGPLIATTLVPPLALANNGTRLLAST